MAELTPEQMARAKRSGASVKTIPKLISVDGLQSLADQLNLMVKAQNDAQSKLIESLDKIVKVIEEKDLRPTDVTQLTKAVKDLKREAIPEREHGDYIIDFERDQRNLIKPGIRITSVPHVIN